MQSSCAHYFCAIAITTTTPSTCRGDPGQARQGERAAAETGRAVLTTQGGCLGGGCTASAVTLASPEAAEACRSRPSVSGCQSTMKI